MLDIINDLYLSFRIRKFTHIVDKFKLLFEDIFEQTKEKFLVNE